MSEPLDLDALRAKVFDPKPCGCDNGWVDDENWQPEDWEIRAGNVTRDEGDGLIPCGACNLGGWDHDRDDGPLPAPESLWVERQTLAALLDRLEAAEQLAAEERKQ